MHRDEIPTPALLLDVDRFERNLARMAAHVRKAGKNLRPHAKTHRCPEIAKRQIAAGALGVACAKLGEAEVMAAAGVRGLLITTEVVPPASIRRLMKLIGDAPDTMLVVDHPDNVRALGRAAAEAGVTLNVLVDIDVGARRTGVEPGAPAVALGRLVAEQRALRLRGLQGYAGQCAHVMGWTERGDASRRAMAPLMETRTQFEKAGLPVEIVAGGSTGTYDIDVELPGLTELQSGLVLRDGSRLPASRRPRRVRADRLRDGDHRGRHGGERRRRPGDGGRGAQGLLHRQAVPAGGRRAARRDLRIRGRRARPPDDHRSVPRRPALGERIEFFPPHCDPTFNLYDRVWVVRGTDVVTTWEIAARGRSD